MTEPVLVADIGGTNARFAIAELGDGAIRLHHPQIFRAEDFDTVRDATDAYYESVAIDVSRACFAAAGPIKDGAVNFTNSQWVLRTKDISDPLGLKQLRIVNDFYALASSINYLGLESYRTIKAGTGNPRAPQLIIGPGTGFGQALIVPTDGGCKVVATEGGHTTFAPQGNLEFEIIKFIEKEHTRVCVERLLSGRGFINLHRALCAIEGAPYVFMQAHEITKSAAEGADVMAVKTVDLFLTILGRVAGDAVLATGAQGGVVLGGGILPKMIDEFPFTSFVKSFGDKDRISSYLDDVPIRLILADGAALYGAAALLDEGRVG